MSKLPETTRHMATDSVAKLELEELIQDYLDHLCAPLVGIVPYARRKDIRRETECHLWMLIEDQAGQGLAMPEAVATALNAHGDPHLLGTKLLDTWYRGPGSKTQPKRYLRFAILRAFACFSTCSALCHLMIGNDVFSGIDIRESPWHIALLLLGPLLVGGATGMLVATRSVQAVAITMGILLIHGTIMGLLLLPSTQGLWLTLFQLAYWLPAGALTAKLTQTLKTYHRRAAFQPLLKLRQTTRKRYQNA